MTYWKRFKLFGLLFVLMAACSTGTQTASDAAGGTVTQGGLYRAQDVALLANTGRPQFLNAYANW